MMCTQYTSASTPYAFNLMQSILSVFFRDNVPSYILSCAKNKRRHVDFRTRRTFFASQKDDGGMHDNNNNSNNNNINTMCMWSYAHVIWWRNPALQYLPCLTRWATVSAFVMCNEWVRNKNEKETNKRSINEHNVGRYNRMNGVCRCALWPPLPEATTEMRGKGFLASVFVFLFALLFIHSSHSYWMVSQFNCVFAAINVNLMRSDRMKPTTDWSFVCNFLSLPGLNFVVGSDL